MASLRKGRQRTPRTDRTYGSTPLPIEDSLLPPKTIKALIGFRFLTATLNPFSSFGGAGRLDFNSRGAVTRIQFEGQVNLCPRKRAVEAHTGADTGGRKRALNHKAFPAVSDNGMPMPIFNDLGLSTVVVYVAFAYPS